MVNQKRDEILNLLKTHTCISGTSIGIKLGISRVAVHKHLAILQREGYPILSTPKGYVLEYLPDDILSEHEVSSIAGNVIFVQEALSTMEIQGAESADDELIIASRQTGGKGRSGRRWDSGPGGLYLTYRTSKTLPPSEAFIPGLCMTLSVCSYLQERAQCTPRISWPNDILIKGKKISGILSEARLEHTLLKNYSIGVGLNINNCIELSDSRNIATSLAHETGKTFQRADAAKFIVNGFKKRLFSTQVGELLSEWNSYWVELGKTVRVIQQGTSITGTICALKPDGAALLDSGSYEKHIYEGDVILLP